MSLSCLSRKESTPPKYVVSRWAALIATSSRASVVPAAAETTMALFVAGQFSMIEATAWNDSASLRLDPPNL